MRRTPILIILIWLVICFGYAYWQIATAMAGPASTDDLYAHTWRYQWFMFCLFWLPAWIAGLLFALSIESFWYRRHLQSDSLRNTLPNPAKPV